MFTFSQLLVSFLTISYIVSLAACSVLAYNITLYFALIITITNTHDTTLVAFFFKSRSI